MDIIAIDPGTTHTGLVYLNEHRVVDAKTVSFPRKACGIDNNLLDERCNAIWLQVERFLIEHPHSVVVIEGYVPYAGPRQTSTLHQTPWLVGFLLARLEDFGCQVAIQTSKEVLNPRSKGNMAAERDLMAKGKRVYEGQQLIKNDHLRTALCHGIYYLIGQGELHA